MSSAKTLQISYIGMQTQEVAIKPNLKVVLKPDTEVLDEVVVVAYGTASRQSITGAVASIDSKKLEMRPVTEVTGTLEGAAPGIQVNNSYGEPGSDKSEIRIRGFGSVNGTNAPLIVVDGSPYGGSLNDINPQDIESISVLKDASSAALYGNKAANGVIMITTKNGSRQGTSQLLCQLFSQFNNNKIDVADADLFAKAVRESCRNGSVMTNLAFGEEYIGKLNSIDWQDEMSRTALQQNYNLSASGGTEATQANLSWDI